ncbi:bZIP transcription factor 44 [Camellia lanceoleosa]|uniref:BZIP transcription factor 44 n=1 Tax=Camellia lanceoleosa TaxID=1840588 RepID=A0ACC0GB85_9ERIC|nr:bZIP transcription factor 44 [Camellia lanceoleosa]
MILNQELTMWPWMKKHKHLNDLTTQVAQLKKKNDLIITSINVTTQHYLNVESVSSILIAQVTKLNHKLESLNEIISFLNASSGCLGKIKFVN